MQHARHAADRNVSNPMPVEDLDDAGEVKKPFSYPLILRIDRTSQRMERLQWAERATDTSLQLRRPADGGCTRPWRANT